jgi:surface polysaccharide O-acyltransferase-like enzyme
MAPFINKGIELIDLRLYKKLLVLMLFICYIGDFVFHRNGTTFDMLLFIYFLGRYIRRANINPNSSTALWLFFATSTLMAFGSMTANILIGERALHVLFNNHNPLIIFSAMCLFFFFKNLKTENTVTKNLSKIAPYTFAVYIIHVNLLYVKLIPFDSIRVSNPYTSTLYISLALLFACSFAELIRSKLTSRIENKIFEAISNKSNPNYNYKQDEQEYNKQGL